MLRTTTSEINTVPFGPPQDMMTPRNGQCTHLTMTRLYTKNFRCAICYGAASLGWLYRCTQDRELLIEDDMERGREEKIDDICDIFPKPSCPRKRSPAARMSKLSFLEEISDNDLKSYTVAQLSRILTQRAQVLDLVKESDNSTLDDESLDPSKTPAKSTQNPWLPAEGAECQFKCCHFCRPTLNERSYLSLDGICQGDIPPTAIVGFGFHLQNYRPVSLVKHVQNLGLRLSLPPRSQSSLITPSQSRDFYLAKYRTPNGLGILNTALPDRALPPLPTPSLSTSLLSTHQTEASLAGSAVVSQLSCESGNEEFEIATLITLPAQTEEELSVISVPLTLMEQSEMKGGFGSAPLEVRSGVAVTEEAVVLHVTDLITQF